jgi:hypothetical protein
VGRLLVPGAAEPFFFHKYVRFDPLAEMESVRDPPTFFVTVCKILPVMAGGALTVSAALLLVAPVEEHPFVTTHE